MGSNSHTQKSLGLIVHIAFMLVFAIGCGCGIGIGSLGHADEPVMRGLTTKEWEETHEPYTPPFRSMREAEAAEYRKEVYEEQARARAKHQREEAIKEAPLRQANATDRLAEEIAALRKELRQAAPRWIPVAERKPEVGKTVLVWNKTDVIQAWYEADGDFTGVCWERIPRVTHWMPLPEPPQ